MERASLSAPFTPVARDCCRNGLAIGTSPLGGGAGDGGREREIGRNRRRTKGADGYGFCAET